MTADRSSRLAQLLADLPGPDEKARAEVAERAAQVLRPPGAFERLDQVAAWLAGWQRTADPRVEFPVVLVFAADHGVAVEGVSAFPSEITDLMMTVVEEGFATINAVAVTVGAEVLVSNVGVGWPSGNIRVEDAMSPAEFDEAVEQGAAAVRKAVDAGADLLVLGELGIGNTTPAAAICGALYGDLSDSAPAGTSSERAATSPSDTAPNLSPDLAARAADRWTGPGTGRYGDDLERKRLVVRDAIERAAADGVNDPLEVLRRLGGRELAAIAGAAAQARRLSIPVVIDGFICTAALAPLYCAVEGSLDHCIAGHCSAEPGHRLLLELMGLSPLLQLDLRLGEGSGAAAAVPLIRIAAAAVTNVATFDEAGIT